MTSAISFIEEDKNSRSPHLIEETHLNVLNTPFVKKKKKKTSYSLYKKTRLLFLGRMKYLVVRR